MRFAPWAGLLGLAAISHASHVPRDYNNNDYYVIHIDSTTSPEQIASRLGLRHEGVLGQLSDHHVFRSPKAEHDIVKRELLQSKRRKRGLGDRDVLDSVLLSTKQETRQNLHKRVIPPPPSGLILPRDNNKPVEWAIKKQQTVMSQLNIRDPIFTEQWHLFNPIQIGHDVNVTSVWLEGVTGKNVTVAIIDDGLDMNSLDLKDNYFAEGSYDFNDHDPVPAPVLSDDRHGTRCAGEIAAVRNDVCGLGVAYESKIAGIRILSKPISDADEAEAMMYKYDKNQIYSCSWGPHDDGRTMEAPGVLIRRAMLKSIQEGRNGLGSIYVFASGNGAASDDNCNFDGYTNSIYSITVGAVDRAGRHPYYSEHCSAQLVVTYSSRSGDSIHTTDVGETQCATGHGGTSAAAALAAGIFALVLEVRPDLGWRDMQYLGMDTAKPVADEHANWQQTAIGKQFSHVFGYGKVDSYDLVQKAKTWKKVKPQAWFFSPWLHVKKAIPEGDHGLIVSFDVTEDMLKKANLERLEHVTVTINVNHTRRGDLSVDLISPSNVVSHIATARKDDSANKGYEDWTFMSVAHWGEKGIGKWTIVVRDTKRNEHQGTFVDWHLKLWGEAIDPAKATKLPMPSAQDDADHDKVDIVTAPAATSTLGSQADGTKTQADKPTDHPERPVKPSATSADEKPSAEEASATATSSSSWIDKFPAFGGSKTATVWVVGAGSLIAVFCIGLGIYFCIARKRQLRNNSRNNYDFELLDEEEGDGLNSQEKNGQGRRTRGGELYDAFAGASDDEEEFDEYRDRSAERLASNEDEDNQYVVGEESDDDDGHGRPESRPLGGGSRP
ncbi:KEX1 protease precursor [Pochonia chlamydosporia 170]|uniref:KEX1 protease n=1 Tax=Pochonia chlamydosporia 170 TaxID=1380566 RepID=A0A179EWP8_METCM|nr:KEX1 protease precursor [Pochonia chlamydosporia 170]OAQ57598.1 KEX1 protease precursor [Pochonia chlamydosporia 170]